MRAHKVTARNVRNRIFIYAPLGFLAVGLALSGVAAGGDGAPGAAVVGVGLALLAAYWLGRRSKVENTAFAVAAAVSVARAEATAAAVAQAHQQVAVLVGSDATNRIAGGDVYAGIETPASRILRAESVDVHRGGVEAHEIGYSGPITSIRDGRPTEDDDATPRFLEEWPFRGAGAPSVTPDQLGVAASDGGGRLARRGDDPGDPVAALLYAQTPPTGGDRVT